MAAGLDVVGVGVVRPHDRSALLVRNFAIYVITAEVASAFAGEGSVSLCSRDQYSLSGFIQMRCAPAVTPI